MMNPPAAALSNILVLCWCWVCRPVAGQRGNQCFRDRGIGARDAAASGVLGGSSPS